MLVLSRKVGERLVIGENVTVVVSKISGNRVTLGIEAPDHVRVIRAELQSNDAEQVCELASSHPKNETPAAPILFDFGSGAFDCYVRRTAK